MLVPGTRTDPEFSAVRVTPWEDEFACSVWLPTTESLGNTFLTPSWRAERVDELNRLQLQMLPVQEPAKGWVATTDSEAVPESTLVVIGSFAEILMAAWRSSGVPVFETWVRDEVLADPDLSRVPDAANSWRYDVQLARIAATATRTQLFVWPDDPALLSATELLSVPHLPTLPEQPDFDQVAPEVVDVARELWRQVTHAEAIYRLTLIHRGLDAVSMLRRATDPQYAATVSPETGLALRKLSRRLRDSVASAGWRLTGFADALAWPLHITKPGQVPAQLVSELAIDLLRRAETVALPPAPDLAEWERGLVEVESLREQRKHW